MICAFIGLHIIIFTKMSASPRQLTEEEANLLFETTFLMISQQNLAEKQKNLKTKTLPPPPQPHASLHPHKQDEPAQPDIHSPSRLALPHVIDLEKMMEKTMPTTCHKLSTDKEESCIDGNEAFPQSPVKQSERDSSSCLLLDGLQLTPTKQSKISEGVSAESRSGHSQMREEAAGELYLEACIKELKRDLEIRSRGKICKSQEINSKTGQVTGYNFYCKTDSSCPFDCLLEYTGERTPKNEKLYRLVVNCDTHLKGCLEDEEEITFMKLTRVIDDMETAILGLLSQNAELKPKEILVAMAQQTGEESHKFIYKGLSSKSYHKAAKKYFDNLIYKIKNQMLAL